MSIMKHEEVEAIAAKYATSIGVAPFLVDGSDFDDTSDPPSWRVYVSFCESSTTEIGFPHSMIVHVNDLTAEPSHVQML